MHKAILTLLLLPIFTYAQNTKNYFEIVGGTTYSFRTSHSLLSEVGNEPDPRKIFEKPAYFPTLGLTFQRKIKSSHFLSIGLQNRPMGYVLKESDKVLENNNIDIIIDPNKQYHYLKATEKISYLDFSLGYKKSFLNRNIHPFIEVGLCPSVFLNEKQIFIWDSQRTTTEDNEIEFKRIAFNANVGCGIDFQVAQNIALVAKMNHVRNVVPSYTNTTTETYLYGTSFQIGIRFSKKVEEEQDEKKKRKKKKHNTRL